jgi:hypothetical protein
MAEQRHCAQPLQRAQALADRRQAPSAEDYAAQDDCADQDVLQQEVHARSIASQPAPSSSAVR